MVDGKPPGARARETPAGEGGDLLQRALAQQQAGRLEAAEADYRALLGREPQNRRAGAMLGLLLLQRGCNGEALALLQPLIEAGVGDAALYNAYALALGGLARFPEAAAAAAQAAALKPDLAELQVNLGNALRKAGRAEEAAAAYRRAIALKPGLGAAQVGLGTALAALGAGSGAAAAYRRALEIQPDSARAFYHWALVAKAGTSTVDPAIIEDFERRLAVGAVSEADGIMLHNALGILADRAGNHVEAFAHFSACKAATRRRLAHQGQAFDAAAHAAFVDALIGAFPGNGKSVGTEGSHRAVFVVGMPRSGTTLVEQILASHSQVAGGGELPGLPRLVSAIPDYPAGTAALSDAALRGLAQDYLAALAAIAPAAGRVTDKLPLNFLHLGLIARLFPEATVVHCQRDPLDTCLSCYLHNFRAGNAFACDLADLGFFYRDYRRIMAHWRAALPLRLVEVSYEGLVAAPEPAIRALVAGAGLPWEEACLAFHKTERTIDTASQLQVRQPIGRGGVGRWRNYAEQLRPLFAALDEEPRQDSAGP